MSIRLVDKELHPMELLQLGPVLMVASGQDIQIEKLPTGAKLAACLVPCSRAAIAAAHQS